MLGYSTVDMDVTEDERKQALSALVLKAEELMRGGCTSSMQIIVGHCG